MSSDAIRKLLTVISQPVRLVIDVPHACELCLYRKPEWRDEGYCYMFREMPYKKCAQFKEAE